MREKKANGQDSCRETAVLEGTLVLINYLLPFVRRLNGLTNDKHKNNVTIKYGLWWKIKKRNCKLVCRWVIITWKYYTLKQENWGNRKILRYKFPIKIWRKDVLISYSSRFIMGGLIYRDFEIACLLLFYLFSTKKFKQLTENFFWKFRNIA
jgi:hypothetical protein